MNNNMQKNRVRYISSAAFLTIAILVAINIQDGEAGATIAQIRESMKPIGDACIPETGVCEEMLAKTQQGEFPADPELQCYYACVFRMMEVMNGNDQIDTDMVMDKIDAMLPEDLAQRVKENSKICFSKITSNDLCVMSWEFTKCFYELDSSLFFFP
uniref:Odorant-binding protein 10 n=1 Tax=Meteorus pulchricornis TaxID=51522 RepID=A0A1S5VFH3_9HYME|nr:odorant-binding protein 6 [Meteorus pulchricornis]AQN78388.1 odorant-binding protein 10 [Meteorus pulchricornis]